ncbi:hypothetical protein EHV15_25590 [Paenibacillus oralis]|uniref:Uncharacterized protein n=1 Tax=Paenibacillus oralis TaxID=2490856 RepID=A0A3P3U8M0_9BACL|nr:hypothetical protein [Paenibacillus oralis]RRJ65919.1 hypothetical protein EHV15_25590 [Paenibacillus oralis]
MMNQAKSMLWLLLSVSFCLTAALITLNFAERQDLALEQLAAQSHVQERSVFSLVDGALAGTQAAPSDSADAALDWRETYSGLSLLYGLQQWVELGVPIVVEGRRFAALTGDEPAEVLEQRRREALSLLDLQGQYETRRGYDAGGQLAELVFTKK